MSKIIIHNKTEKDDVEAIQYLEKVLVRLIEKPNYEYFEFEDGVRVQVVNNKTCRTFYVY